MIVSNPKPILLASGPEAKALVMRPNSVSVDPGFRDLPSRSETRAAQLLGEARLGKPLTPVPGPQEMLATPETLDHASLGLLDVFSKRAKAALQADGLTQAPLFLLRQHTDDLTTSELVANSNYFLFLEPDLDCPWNAYGDPIGLVMSGGIIDYAPQLPRACLMMTDGTAAVQRLSFSDVQITVPGGQKVNPHGFGAPDQTTPFTGFARFFGAQEGAAPAGAGYDMAYIGRYPAVGGPAGTLPIPRSGCVIRFPTRDVALSCLGALDIRLTEPWRDGVQAGPQILKNNEIMDAQVDVFATEHMTETDGLPEAGTVSPARWKADWDETRAARLGAGIDADGQLIFVAIEGSSSFAGHARRGPTLRDLAVVLKEHGCVDALHLDGGGSTQVFGQAGGTLIAPNDIHHGLSERNARYDRPIPTWLKLT